MSAARGLRVIAFAFMGLLAVGCASKKPPPPMVAPDANVEIRHFTGTPLSGPLMPAVEVKSPEEAMSVKVSLIALESLPSGVLPPLGPKARFIAASNSGRAAEPSTRLTLGTQLASGSEAEQIAESIRSEQFGRFASMGEFDGALPQGVTVVLTAAAADASANPADAAGRKIIIGLSRRPTATGVTTSPTENIELAVVLQDWVVVEDAVALAEEAADAQEAKPLHRTRDEFGQDVPPPPVKQTMQREIAIVDDLPVGERLPLALLVPFQFDGESQALTVLIDVSPGTSDEAHAQAVARCAEDLIKSAQAVAERPSVFMGNSDWPGYESALASIRQPATRRAAMVFLASQTGASICEDVSLVCDELLLDHISRNVGQNSTATTDARTRDTLGWLLDYTTLDLLTKWQSDGKLPAELAAVLSIHAGEAGRHASSMEEIMRNLASRKDLQSRLVAENLIYLEDSSPAARVRAYDWLTAHGHAPADFDPLADNKQRRDALERALEAMQAQSTEGAGQ